MDVAPKPIKVKFNIDYAIDGQKVILEVLDFTDDAEVFCGGALSPAQHK